MYCIRCLILLFEISWMSSLVVMRVGLVIVLKELGSPVDVFS
jgi:hypothetical protein